MFGRRHPRARDACWLLLLAAPLIQAHDFWLQPAFFHAVPDSEVSFTVQVGHGAYRQRSPVPIRRIKELVVMAPDGSKTDMRKNLQLGGEAADGSIQVLREGTYVVVLETDDTAQSHLPAARFNDYLRVEGLTPAMEARAQQRRTNAEGSERYGRRAKALLQVGAGAAGDAVCKPLGLTLEIVPERNPYAIVGGDLLPIRVFFENKPLAGALVKLTDLAHDAEPADAHVTDTSGRALFRVPHGGTWLLNTIWTTPLPPTDAVEFETIFSSLSFEVE